MNDGLGRKIMKEFVALRAKTYSYLTSNNDEDKRAKSTKKCLIERRIKFEDNKNCLEATGLENKINHLEKNKIDEDNLTEHHEEQIDIKITIKV